MFKGLKALLAGLLAGTALGILFSPKKGEDIRHSIKKEVDEGGTGLSAIADTLAKMGRAIGQSAKETYEELSETEGFKKGVAKAKSEVKKAAKKAVKKIPARTRRQAKSALKKAGTVVKKAKDAVSKKLSN